MTYRFFPGTFFIGCTEIGQIGQQIGVLQWIMQKHNIS